MNDNKNSIICRLFSLRNLFVWGNIILFVLFTAVLVKDQIRGWKKYQKEYKTKEIERIKSKMTSVPDAEKDGLEMELIVAKKTPIEIRQVWSQQINAIDRCITCHLGYDPLSNPSLTTEYKEQPFSAPADSVSLEIHKAHDIQKFGCVVCHGGQGMATEVKAAHGEVLHWEKPLLKGALLQSACAQCHDNLSELKIKNQVYPSEVIRAKTIFKESGCIGCHQIGGEGGPISVDLREETSAKPLSRIDFSSSGLPHEKHTLANWIKIHFTMDPVVYNPGDPKAEFNTEPIAPSAMPAYLMSEKDADALTAYILGLNRKYIPSTFVVQRPPVAELVPTGNIAHGRYVYDKYGCAACHGSDARGGIRNYNAQHDVIPNLRRAISTYSREQVKEKINEGVAFVAKHHQDGPQPPLYMPSWKSKIKGEELEDLVSYLFSIKE